MNTSEQIINIVAKKLHGEATSEELAVLQAWLDGDKEHQQEYERLEKIWEKANEVLSLPSFDANAAWEKIDAGIHAAGINKGEIKPAITISMLFRKRWAIAAAAVVFFAVGLFFLYKDNSKWQTVTAENANLSINLPDQSVVLLRKGSSLKYPPAFDKENRLVELTGEAYFDVHRNEHQPFIITTANSKVKVLGTSFLVRSKPAIDEVVVVTGKVSVTEKENSGNQVLLVAGQMTVLKEEKFQQRQVEDANYIAWKSGLLDFKDASLSKVLEDVSDFYEKTIVISDQQMASIEKIHITVRFENQSLEQVLEEIKLITGLGIKKENNKTIFFQK